ncbi:transmembrane protease serine 4 isoform X6 [Lepidochelys kempii]|uniref:transmembrane protease serine 4 isoform X6 n=1 Tax=Lepidochelys kempii TaxID=8472 RepID=UPI003C6FC5A8
MDTNSEWPLNRRGNGLRISGVVSRQFWNTTTSSAVRHSSSSPCSSSVTGRKTAPGARTRRAVCSRSQKAHPWKSECPEARPDVLWHGTEMDLPFPDPKMIRAERGPFIPAFRAVDIADTQGLPLREVTLNNGVLQGQDSGRQCLSGTVVSLACATCGESVRSPRVVGGGQARIDAWPWQVSLQHKTQHLCGGSIIDPRWILTAAHCFKNNLALQNWRVKAGSEILSNFNTIPVEKIFIIDSNHMFPKDNDIALVKLTSPLSISDTVKPICLPFFDEELPSHAPLWVTGWGYTEQNGTLSKSLQQAQIKLIDSNTCNAVDAYQGDISDRMICAGLTEGGVDTCQGDSGGPLMYNPGHWQVVGIVSWGHGCGRPSTPGVYTKVQGYLNWIYTVQRVSILVSETSH